MSKKSYTAKYRAHRDEIAADIRACMKLSDIHAKWQEALGGMSYPALYAALVKDGLWVVATAAPQGRRKRPASPEVQHLAAA